MRIGLFLSLLVLGASSAAAVEQVFVNIATIPGESTQPGHVNWIDAYALSHDGTRPSGSSLSLSEVTVLKGPDRATPQLHNALAVATNLGLVTVQLCGTAAAEPSRCYYKLELSNTRVTGVSVAESTCSADGCTPAHTESVSFSFSRIKWFYTDPAGAETSRCFDLALLQPC
jgi:type VI secretion system Hcp family effector